MSQPWLTEAVGTGGVDRACRCGAVLERAGLGDDAVEVLFTGLDRGIEGGVEQLYERSLPRAEALGDDALLAYELNGEPLPPQHGFPLRLVIAGWYGMAHVKWLGRITALTEPFAGYQQAVGYRMYDAEGDAGAPVTPHPAALADGPAGHPRLHDARAVPRRRALPPRGPRLVGLGPGRARRGERRRRRDLGRRAARRAAGRPCVARLVLRVGRAGARQPM